MVTRTSLSGILLALAWSAFASNNNVGQAPTVHLPDGEIIGFTLNNTNAFRGIPYAAPPVKTLRFYPPQPPTPWTKPLHATTFAPSCLQMGSPDFKAQGAAWNTLNLTSSDEDCLYLNVYIPATATASEPLPVMVYLHAGEFRFGSSDDLENSWPYFAKGNIILVTGNVRLGYFGFAALDALRSNDPQQSTGNYGLQDQRQVLKWVNSNIHLFGGDRGKVTIFGESSGGSSVGFHATSRASQPYFQRAIMESPGLTQSHSFWQSETNTQYLLSSLTAAQSQGCRWPKSHGSGSGRDHGNGLDTNNNNAWRVLPGLGVFAQSSPIATLTTLPLAQAKCLASPTCLLIASTPKVFSNTLKYVVIGAPSQAGGFNSTSPLFFENMTSAGNAKAASYVVYLRMGDQDNSVDCLVKAAASDLVAINLGTPFSDTFITDATAPTVDGVELKRPLDERVLDPSMFSNKMDLLSGANLDEGTEFMEVAPPIACNANQDEYQQWCNHFYGLELGPLVPSLYNNATLIQPIPLCRSRGHSKKKTTWQWQAAMRSAGDSAILCRARSMLRASNASTYMYYFTHTPAFSLNMDDLQYYGAFHGAEVPFVFGLPAEIITDAERSLSAAMGCYWTSFATTGSPNSGDCVSQLHLPQWPMLDDSGDVLQFEGSDVGAPVKIVKGLKNKACSTFAKYYNK